MRTQTVCSMRPALSISLDLEVLERLDEVAPCFRELAVGQQMTSSERHPVVLSMLTKAEEFETICIERLIPLAGGGGIPDPSWILRIHGANVEVLSFSDFDHCFTQPEQRLKHGTLARLIYWLESECKQSLMIRRIH